jgi:acyl-coenzyme A thioesterase PaaI-like protein
MRRIVNPFTRLEGYNCFACSPANKNGLRMEFYEDGDEVISVWQPGPNFNGYGNILHGGIQATLLDEVSAWFVYIKLDTAGVTSGMDIKYLKPVYINAGPVKIRSRLHNMEKNIVNIKADLYSDSGILCSSAVVSYFTYPEKMARERLHYPGKGAFFNE